MKRFAEFVNRVWPLWLLLWLAAWGSSAWYAPHWDDVATEGEMRHLPPDSPTRRAAALFEEAFPGERTDSNIVLVLERPDEPLKLDDFRFLVRELAPQLQAVARQHGGIMRPSDLERLLEYLHSLKQRMKTAAGPRAESTRPSLAVIDRLIDAIQTPGTPERDEAAGSAPNQQSAARRETGAGDQPPEPRVVSLVSPHNSVAAPLLISEDRRALIVMMNLTSSFLTTRNHPLIRQVENRVATLQMDRKVPAGLKIHITGSAVVGRDVVQAVTKSTQAIRTWTIWLVLLLLLVVFRAPLIAAIPLATMFCAVEVSLNLLSILAAAGYLHVFDGLHIYMTVLVYGASVDYSLFLISRHQEELQKGSTVRQAGVVAITAVGIAVIVSAGTEMFGIGMLSFSRFGKFQQAGHAIPLGLAATLLASLTLTFSLLRVAGKWGFWPRRFREQKAGKQEMDLDENVVTWLWHGIGLRILHRPLITWLAGLALLAPAAIVAITNHDNLTYDMVSELPPDSPSLEGNRVLQKHFSAGIVAPVTVLLRNDQVDFGSPEGVVWLERISNQLRERREELMLADVRGLADPLGSSERLREHIGFVNSFFPDSMPLLPGENELVDAAQTDPQPAQLLEDVVLYFARSYYVSQAEEHRGHVARMSLMLDEDPFIRKSIEQVPVLREEILKQLPPPLRDNTTVIMSGATASLYDISVVADGDLRRIYVLASGAVLLVLVLVLRKPIVSFFLVLSVVLTYLAALGTTFLVFAWLLGDAFIGLEWTVPVLLFALLMAVGADYNVMLVERTREEAERHAYKHAVVRALAATGGLISGAGLVMAGTFSALIWGGKLTGMHQLGFALSCGVLIDTFLVRPLLVPSFLILAHRLRRMLPAILGGLRRKE